MNEYSTRYSIAIDRAQATEPHAWRSQASGNRQGSGDYLPPELGGELTRAEEDLQRLAREVYEQRIQTGVAREQARKDLPLSTYTEAYWKTDLHNLFHFLALRMDVHAQAEIRAYANTIGHKIVSRWCPEAWQAFVDYRQSGMILSRAEVALVQALEARNIAAVRELAQQEGWLAPDGTPNATSRERQEVEHKLALLGISSPWSQSG